MSCIRNELPVLFRTLREKTPHIHVDHSLDSARPPSLGDLRCGDGLAAVSLGPVAKEAP
jgi:hypothetical protein